MQAAQEVTSINPLQEQARNVLGGIFLPGSGSNSESFSRALRSLEVWQQQKPEIKGAANLLVASPEALLQRAGIAVLGMGTTPDKDGNGYKFPGETEDLAVLYRGLPYEDTSLPWKWYERGSVEGLSVKGQALITRRDEINSAFSKALEILAGQDQKSGIDEAQIKNNLTGLVRQHLNLKEINGISGYSSEAAADEILERLKGFIKSRKLACGDKEKVKAAISV